MITLVAFTTGLVIWVVLWSMGAKSLDAFLPTVILTVTAVTIEIMLPAVRRFTAREDPTARV